ncbi:MAG: hypothetical protein IPL61_32285 [Myxococcales bacterium]|nr:hypothetical protein [Myxococcales bacterium]
MTDFDPTDDAPPAPASTRALLERAALASVEDDVTLDDFMRTAWFAYTQARPGMRAALEEAAMRNQMAELRARGQLAMA